MTTNDYKELFKPRWKLIVEYPNSKYEFGKIYETFGKNNKYISPFLSGDSTITNPEQYPAIFKKLEWWEDRKEEDMPQYLVWKNLNHSVKVIKYYLDDKKYTCDCGTNDSFRLINALPSTKEKYDKQRSRISKAD